MTDLLTDLRALAAELQGQMDADDVEANRGADGVRTWFAGHREGVRLSRNRLLAIVEKYDVKE